MSAGPGYPRGHSSHHDCGLDHHPRRRQRGRHERHARRHLARCLEDDTSAEASGGHWEVEEHSWNTQDF